MSTFNDAVLLARARISALRALVRSGGRPTAAQLLRAVEPVLGDLVPIPAEAASGDLEREFWGVLLGRWQSIDAALSVPRTLPARVRQAAGKPRPPHR